MSYVEALPNGRFRGAFRLAAKPGQRRGQRVSRTFDYQYEAEAWATAAEDAAKSAASSGAAILAPAPKPVEAPLTAAQPVTGATVAEWGRELIERRSGRLAAATISGYTTHLAGIVLSGMGERPMADLKRSDVERWITDQRRAGTGKPTINARLKLLRMIVGDACAERVIEHDPASRVDYLTTDIKADRVLTRAEDAALLLACPEPLRVAALLGLDAGLRWSEAYGLKANAISGDFIVVRHVVERTTRTIREYPKGHRLRVVPIGSDRLASALDELAESARRERGHDGLLFVSKTGGPMPYESWRMRQWQPAVTAAKLKPAPGFHMLRHTYGSRLAAMSAPRSEIATLMGHADEETTARYIHAGDDGRRLALVRGALGG